MTRNKAFTLVELLTVIVIISILASLSLFALNGAYEEAKIAKTRGTITKLDVAIQQIFEGYEEKFDAISIDKAKLQRVCGRVPTTEDVARAKLFFIRDLMRMEMPHNWIEVADDPVAIVNDTSYGNPYATDAPAVKAYYIQALKSIAGNALNPGVATNNSYAPPAELLYLIIANLNPEALENFHGSEIGDIDGNGLLEFHDAWGTPIRFLRCAPAFTGGDKQPDIIAYSGVALKSDGTNTDLNNSPRWLLDRTISTPTTAMWGGPAGATATDWNDPTQVTTSPERELVDAMKTAVEAFHDPFDLIAMSANQTRGWFLYPLIVSAGPDKLFDTQFDDGIVAGVSSISRRIPWSYIDQANYPSTPSGSTYDPNTNNPFRSPLGMPEDLPPPSGVRNGVLNHFDNIHNHRQAGGF